MTGATDQFFVVSILVSNGMSVSVLHLLEPYVECFMWMVLKIPSWSRSDTGPANLVSMEGWVVSNIDPCFWWPKFALWPIFTQAALKCAQSGVHLQIPWDMEIHRHYIRNPPSMTPDIDLLSKSTHPYRPGVGWWREANYSEILQENVVENVLNSESNVWPCRTQFIWGCQHLTKNGWQWELWGVGWASWDESIPAEELFLTHRFYIW